MLATSCAQALVPLLHLICVTHLLMFVDATAVRVPKRAVVVLPQNLDNGGRFLRLDDYGGACCVDVVVHYRSLWLHAAMLWIGLCDGSGRGL